MKEMPSVKQVKELYIKSLLELAEFDKQITTAEQEQRFSKLVENIYERHSGVLVQMAKGAYEYRNRMAQDHGDAREVFSKMEDTHAFLDRFYLSSEWITLSPVIYGMALNNAVILEPISNTLFSSFSFHRLLLTLARLSPPFPPLSPSGIGIRVLIGQYLALRQPPVPNYIGMICSETSPYEIVKRAIDDAAFMCAHKYGDAPDVIIEGQLDLTFPYVPTHLRKSTLSTIINPRK